MFDFVYKEYRFHCDIGTMTPLQYIRMITILEDFKPKRVCELGSGISTDIFDVYGKKVNCVRYSIENDPYYLRHENTILMPLDCDKYDGLEGWLEKQDKFDFVLIDGPNEAVPFNTRDLEYARIQLFDFVLMDKLNDKAVVMYHDSEREVAQRTLNEFERLLRSSGFAYSKEIVMEGDKEVIEYNKGILGMCPELTIYKIEKL